MTLIEIIIVIAMVGLLLSLGVSVLTDWFEDNLTKITSQLSGTIRYVYDESAVKNQTYRLKIDLNSQTFSVEAAAGPIKVEKNEAKHSEEAEASPEKESFAAVSSYLLAPIQLPEGIRIKDVYVTHENKKIDAGVTAIYFFPNGWVEKAVINLTDEKEEHFYSLETHSLTGKTTIRNEYLDYVHP